MLSASVKSFPLLVQSHQAGGIRIVLPLPHSSGGQNSLNVGEQKLARLSGTKYFSQRSDFPVADCDPGATERALNAPVNHDQVKEAEYRSKEPRRPRVPQKIDNHGPDRSEQE